MLHHGRKSALLNTLKEELVEIEAAAEESVHKVEEKDRRLAFIESIMDNLQTQAGGLKARVKAHSFKIKAEERVALLASSCLVNGGELGTDGVRCIGAGQLDASRLRRGYMRAILCFEEDTEGTRGGDAEMQRDLK